MIKLDEEKKKKNYNSHGLGTYYMRGERYEWRLTQDGVTRYASARTKPELDLKIKKIKGTTAQGAKITVAEWFDNWLENYVKQLKKQATYDQYNSLYIKHIKPCMGKKRLVNVTTNDIQNLIADMNKKGLSTCTMKHVKKILHVGYERAIDVDKLLEKNPVYKIDIPKKQAKTRKVLVSEELSKLFESMKNSRWIWSVKFDLVTALRRGELLGLEWGDIDIPNKKALVKQSNSRTGMGDLKSSESHFIPLSDLAIKYLEGQQEMLDEENNENSKFVFPNRKGKVMNPASYCTLFTRFADKVGIKASPHSMRHTFVYFTRGTIDIKDLQNILGHSSSTQTLEIYGNILNDSNDKNISAIDTAFENVGKQIEEKKKAKILQFVKPIKKGG